MHGFPKPECLLIAIFLCAGCKAQETKSETYPVKISWEYSSLAPAMHIHELTGEGHQPGTTKVIEETASSPIGSEIPDSTLRLHRGERKVFALVYKNTSIAPIYFLAAPHTELPKGQGFDFEFKCLCIKHAFRVDPGKVWYRIVSLYLSESPVWFPTEIRHLLVGMSEKQAIEYNQQTDPKGFVIQHPQEGHK